MKRARSPLLSLAGTVLLGTVLLWAGTTWKGYWWCTNSLPGEHRFSAWAGGGRIGFDYADLKRYPSVRILTEGFESEAADESYRSVVGELPDFGGDTSSPGMMRAWCPTWFPGTLLGGLLLGWGLLCRREGE